MYRRTKNCKIVIFHQILLKIVTNENGDKISLQNVECKFPYSFLDMGERVALSKSNFFFKGFFMKIEQVSINFGTDCSYYEKYLGRVAFFYMLSEWS